MNQKWIKRTLAIILAAILGCSVFIPVFAMLFGRYPDCALLAGRSFLFVTKKNCKTGCFPHCIFSFPML